MSYADYHNYTPKFNAGDKVVDGDHLDSPFYIEIKKSFWHNGHHEWCYDVITYHGMPMHLACKDVVDKFCVKWKEPA